jgi:hypothetical protein
MATPIGKVNYVSYVGKQDQKSHCRRLRRYRACRRMCKSFFSFYPEPKEDTCYAVKPEWYEECNLRY